MFELKLKTYLEDLENLVEKYPQASRDARISKITEALHMLEAEVKPKTPWGAGPIHLRDSIHPTGPHVSGQKVWGTLGTSLEHGEPVEYGSKPHFPPIGPLQFWVEKKLGLSGKEATSVAYAIAHTIAKKGTKGRHMFEKGFDAAENRVLRLLNQIPADILRRVQ